MVAALAVSAADALQAQSAGKLSLAPKVGVAVPAGAIGEYADPGPAAGLRLGYELRPGVSLVADGEVNFLKGTNLHKGLPNGIWTPDMKAMRYIAGLEARLGSEETAPWSLLASLGAGASLFDTDSYRSATSNQTRTFEKTALTAAG